MRSLVCIHHRDGSAAGYGMLGPNYQHIVTCDHILRDIEPRLQRIRPKYGETREFDVSFPFSDEPDLKYRALALRLLSRHNQDIACLKVHSGGPITTQLEPLVPYSNRLKGTTAQVYAHLHGHVQPMLVTVKFVGPVSPGLCQVELLNSSDRFEEGYSGSPIISDNWEFAAGIFKGFAGTNRGYFIDGSLLIEVLNWADLGGSPNWTIGSINDLVLPALLEDLMRCEDDGIDEEVCTAVKDAFRSLTNAVHLAINNDGMFSDDLHKSFSKIYSLYDKWNGNLRNNTPEAQAHRAEMVEEMRMQLSRWNTFAHGPGYYEDEQVHEQFQQLAMAFMPLVISHRSIFRHAGNRIHALHGRGMR